MYSKKTEFSGDNLIGYTKDKGLGIVDISEVGEESRTDSEAALKCGGWNKRRLAEQDNKQFEEASISRNVVIYRIDVPEYGTYRVNVQISLENADLVNDKSAKMSVFAGRRNMIDHSICLEYGKGYMRSFYQAVTPYIKALSSERIENKCIFVSVAGLKASDIRIMITITREDVPVIWVAGDSTLTDQNAGIPYYPYGSCAGWAQTLQRFIKGAAVCNLAHSGMTTNCFRDDGHFDIVKELIKPGDFFIMQFGHNDQKRRNLSAFGGYADNLISYVKEIREFGAHPILCSPISRIPLVILDSFYSLLNTYAESCKKVAEEQDVTYVDLHKRTFDKWCCDVKASHDYFMPGDITHTNEYGACLISWYFMEEIRNSHHEDARKFEVFDNHRGKTVLLPEHDTKILPKELPAPDIFQIEPPYVDIKDIPEYEGIKKAFRYGLLDPCVMYLHPYASMPRAQFLMVLFKAFGKNGVRPYKGDFEDIFLDEWDSGYVQSLIEENAVNTNTNKFRPDEPLSYEEFSEFIIKLMEADKEKKDRLSESFCLEKAKELGILTERNGLPECSREEPYGFAGSNEITRAEVYSSLARVMEITGKTNADLPSDAEVHPVH